VASGAVSASEYDQIKAAADSARADLSAAQAQANVAQNATGYAVLLADSDGVVMETLAEPGQVVSAGQVVIRLARAGQREALVQLRRRCARHRQRSAGHAYGNEKQPVTATLRLLSDSADATTRTYEARYVLDGLLANAPLGATVTLNVQDKKRKARSCRCRWLALRCGQRSRRLAHFRQPAKVAGRR
jgi:multidrug efflux pump subunit AcrA (membrane-fusion protein)